MKTLLFVYFALVVIALSSCQKSGEAKVSGLSAQCMSNPSLCNSGAYQQSPGYSSYGYNSGYNPGYGANPYATPFTYANNTAYLCNCPAGSMPTYNSYAGLGCVSSSSIRGHLFGYFYLGWGSNSQWYNQGRLDSYSYPSTGSSCYNGAVQSCHLAITNGCPTGSVCRATNGGSSLGLCVAAYR